MKKKVLALACAALTSLVMNGCSPKTNNTENEKTEAVEITLIDAIGHPVVHDHQLYPNVPDSLWEALGLQEGVPSAINCFLLQIDSTTLLIDAGLDTPTSQLQPTLTQKGLKAEDVQYIYISHLHPDHIGGLLHDGKAVFAEAQLYINSKEAEAWKAMPSDQNGLAMAVMTAYGDRIHTFNAGDTLPGGVIAIAAYGHTPGHTLFQKDSNLFVSDLIHGAALQLEHPEYGAAYDMDAEAACQARKEMLAYAKENQLKIYGMHIRNCFDFIQ